MATYTVSIGPHDGPVDTVYHGCEFHDACVMADDLAGEHIGNDFDPDPVVRRNINFRDDVHEWYIHYPNGDRTDQLITIEPEEEDTWPCTAQPPSR